MKNAGCVLLPARTSLKAPFRKKIKLFTFINKEFLRCQVPSGEGLYEWDMQATKIVVAFV